MLTEIRAANFKLFGDPGLRLSLAPLTILLGPNGSGKTSALDALGLLAQSAPMPNTGGGQGIKWQGRWVDFSSDGIYASFQRDVEKPMSLGFSLLGGSAFAKWQTDAEVFPVKQIEGKSFGYLLVYGRKPNLWIHQLSIDERVVAQNEVNRVISADGMSAGFQTSLKMHISSGLVAAQPAENGPAVLRDRLFTPVFQQHPLSPENKAAEELAGMMRVVLLYMSDYLRSKVFMVGSGREPRDSQPELPPGALSVGRHGEYTLPLLSVLFSRPEYRSQAARIREWASRFSLENLTAGWSGEPTLAAGYNDPTTSTPLRLGDAGFGSQQLLPVITQLFCAPPGSVIVIEEPEMSLHPEAQIAVMKMFFDAVRGGQQVIFTTHSPTLLSALSEAAKEIPLNHDDVAIYHFSREQDRPTVQRLPLDKRWYIPNWIPSFSRVESRLLKDWINNIHDELKKEG